MAEYESESISPTVKKVLDEFINVLRTNGEVDIQSVNNLDKLLQIGKIPKFEEIDDALSPPTNGDKS
jgi:hypothetical protein